MLKHINARRINFQRIVSSGNFIPEIDGLRFIAITSVVLYHISGFIDAKDSNYYHDSLDFGLISRLVSYGYLGVPLFFVISGFILGRPFASYFITSGRAVRLKTYFMRRLTRLEPPYIVVMTALFLSAVFMVKAIPFQQGSLSYLSSIAYIHNFVYGLGTLPLLNGVVWSLEIEVQFYVLAPILAYIFAIQNPVLRRCMIVLSIILSLLVEYVFPLPYLSLLNYLEYFLVGFLLVDLYVCKSSIFRKTRFDFLVGLMSFFLIWLLEMIRVESTIVTIAKEASQLICIFFFYYYVLFHKIWSLLSKRVITNIGGMCYSIYLLHYPIISMFGNPLMSYQFSSLAFINTTIYSVILLVVVLVFSSTYFLLIERPCMDPEWYKKFKKWPIIEILPSKFWTYARIEK